MKKLITMILVGLMLISGTIAVNAEDPAGTAAQNLPNEGQGTRLGRLAEPKLKEFIDEIHAINGLRAERNRLRAQVIEKNDQIIDLELAAREAGNMEAMKTVKAEKEKLKSINTEIKTMHDQAEAARKAYREALKAGDSESARAELEKLANAYSSINDKTEIKLQILDSIISVLS